VPRFNIQNQQGNNLSQQFPSFTPLFNNLLNSFTGSQTQTQSNTQVFPSVQKRDYNLIFATSKTYSGDLAKYGGPDAICQKHADEAKLGGTFKAFISFSNQEARQRLTNSNKPYKNIKGKLLATNGADLLNIGISGSNPRKWIEAAVDEYGNALPDFNEATGVAINF